MGKNPDVYGAQEVIDEGDWDFPSEYVLKRMKAIEAALGPSFFKRYTYTPWGAKFVYIYPTGKDLLETSGTSATTAKIAWIVSAAAHTLARKVAQGLSVVSPSPFLLFLVPSSKKARKVETICRPLKPFGIDTITINPDASLDLQIQSLKKTCDPEFLISTPERLLELVSIKAIDISSVSMLVIDGIEALCKSGLTDAIKSIKKLISGNPRLVVFSDSFSPTSIPMVRHLLTGSIIRLSLNNSITSLSSCIVQSVKVFTSEEDKIVKSIEVLDQFRSSHSRSSNLLYILRKDAKCYKLVKTLKSQLVKTLKSKGCSTSGTANFNDSVDSKNIIQPVVYMIDVEQIFTVDIKMYDVIVLPSFVPSMDTYVHILTKMARESVNGVLHSFFTKGDGELAQPLISILEQCGQEVPQTLRDLHDAHTVAQPPISILEQCGHEVPHPAGST